MTELYSRDQRVNKEDPWRLVQLENDKNRVWWLEWDGRELNSMSGSKGGKITKRLVDTEPKGGKTRGQQAHQEAFKRFDDKVKEGYFNPDLVAQGLMTIADPLPMLAKTYVPSREYDRLKREDNLPSNATRITRLPVLVQAKFDGIRMLAKNIDGRIRLRSRENNEFSFMDHIREASGAILRYLPPGTELDGEAYTEDLSFEKITSVTRQVNERSPLEDKIKYFIFDVILPEDYPYEERMDLFQKAFNKAQKDTDLSAICVVVSHEVDNEDDIMKYHDLFVDRGYEGLMVRAMGGHKPTKAQLELSFYQPDKRSAGLLKFKKFFDDEFKVVGVTHGVGAEAELAMIQIYNPHGKTDKQKYIDVRPRSSFEQRHEWYLHPEPLIGKKYTVRYQEITPDGSLRFPVGIAFRDYE